MCCCTHVSSLLHACQFAAARMSVRSSDSIFSDAPLGETEGRCVYWCKFDKPSQHCWPCLLWSQHQALLHLPSHPDKPTHIHVSASVQLNFVPMTFAYVCVVFSAFSRTHTHTHTHTNTHTCLRENTICEYLRGRATSGEGPGN